MAVSRKKKTTFLPGKPLSEKPLSKKSLSEKFLSEKPKVIVILGPTASGKTKLGVKLAHDFKGEIISADSRQVYIGMDIGTGKDLAEYKINGKKIAYHLIDVVSPKVKFNLARYQRLALKEINNILKRQKVPFIVGGTGLYIQALTDNYRLSNFKSSAKERLALEKLGAAKLFKLITKAKPEFAARLNNSERHNARRLARYLEIINSGQEFGSINKEPKFSFLILGLEISDDKMRAKIKKRLKIRLEKEGLIEEVKRLRESGISFQRLISFGLEYKFVAYYLQNKISYSELEEQLETAIYRFAKKQKTWFKRFEKQGGKIIWIKNEKEARRAIRDFLV